MSISKKIVAISGAAVAIGFAALPLGASLAAECTDDNAGCFEVNVEVDNVFGLTVEDPTTATGTMTANDKTDDLSELYHKLLVSTNNPSGYTIRVNAETANNTRTGGVAVNSMYNTVGVGIPTQAGTAVQAGTSGWNFSVYSNATAAGALSNFTYLIPGIDNYNTVVRTQGGTNEIVTSDPTWVRYNVATSDTIASGDYLVTLTYKAVAS